MGEKKHKMIRKIARDAIVNGCELSTDTLVKMLKNAHRKLNRIEKGRNDVRIRLMMDAMR